MLNHVYTTDNEAAKNNRLSKYTEPTRYWYKPKKFSSQNTSSNWFLGGKDSCFGDSGGPIWRNINVGYLYQYRYSKFLFRKMGQLEPLKLELYPGEEAVLISTDQEYIPVSK